VLADPLPTLLVASLAAFALALLSAVAGFGLPGARTQYERALQISEAAHGPDHPNVGIARNNLGRVLQALGELPGARTQYERALQISEAALGPDHRQTRQVRRNLDDVV
jgi:tetratricopeptide (TPR) repeat protein